MTARPGRGRHPAVAAERDSVAYTIGQGLRISSAVLLIAALIFAPWCWACTWPAGIHVLNLLLIPATFLGLVSALLRHDRLPRELMLGIMLVLLQGWAMTLNSRSLWAAGFYAPLQQPLEGWPGSVERDFSSEMMSRLTGMIGVLFITVLFGQEQRWRQVLMGVMTLTAASIVVLGCCERWTGAYDIFWSSSRHLDYFFGTFRNVTNAGEYLNLALPLASSAVLSGMGRGPLYKTSAVLAFVIILTGTCICGSRMAPLLALVVMGVLLALTKRELGTRTVTGPKLLVTGVVVAFALALMMNGGGWEVAQDRWQRLFQTGGEETVTNRLRVDGACMPALWAAGPLGFGPGTFSAIFPPYQMRLAPPLPGRWLNAHNDYFQTLLEWGWVGLPAWILIFGGGMLGLVLGLRRGGWRRWDRIHAAGLLSGLGGVALMALIDFPLQIASIQLVVATGLGLAWSCFAWPQARATPSKIVLRNVRLFLPFPPTVS